MAQALEQKLQPEEAYRRLTAPQHITASHFLAQQPIEGYFENRNVPGFLGSVRLLKLDSQYGTIQLGYNPRKKQSFLFANIKTSILDTAASRYQRELADQQMMRALKTGTQNLAFTARRRGASSVLLYKMETLPWGSRSVAAYLGRNHMEALRKTLPFEDRGAEHAALAENTRQQRELQNTLRGQMAAGQYAQMAGTRAEQLRLGTQREQLHAVRYRKDTQARLFYRKINIAFDLQKQKMFDHYRRQGQQGHTGGAELTQAEPPGTGTGNDGGN